MLASPSSEALSSSFVTVSSVSSGGSAETGLAVGKSSPVGGLGGSPKNRYWKRMKEEQMLSLYSTQNVGKQAAD
jgi:hypothetical protein